LLQDLVFFSDEIEGLMRLLHRVSILTAFAALSAVIVPQAGAGLVGGTYTNAGAPASTWAATSASTGSPKQYQSGVNPTTSPTAQGYVNQDASATGTIMGEVVTPTSAFKLDTISVELGGAGTIPTGLSLHVFTLGSATAMPNLATDSGAFYFVNSDLLGGGSGLAYSSGGVSSTSIINFTLDNTGTSDQVTLAAGTQYAIELWNQATPYGNTPITWIRNAVGDPGGQGFAKPNTTNTASRNTLAANGQAGGAPRVFQIALYGTAVPEPASLVLFGIGAVAIVAGRSMRRKS
jgi:hypothetical protein